MLAFPAKLVVGDTVPLIQKQRPFLFPLFTHSWQYDHLPSFFTQAVRRGYVTPNRVFLSLPPSGGVASLLSSQSHIPFALLFHFQGAMKRSFTYSHWERSNSNPEREKYFEFEKPLHSFGQRVPKCTPIFGVFSKTFSKKPFTYLELQSRNATCFLKKSSKFFWNVRRTKKESVWCCAYASKSAHFRGDFRLFFAL